jgi:hypothetical protein
MLDIHRPLSAVVTVDCWCLDKLTVMESQHCGMGVKLVVGPRADLIVGPLGVHIANHVTILNNTPDS